MESKRLPEVGETVTVTDLFGKSSLVDVSSSDDSAFEYMGDDGLKHMRMAAWRGDKELGWNFLPKAEESKPMKRVPKVGDRIKFIKSGNIAEVLGLLHSQSNWLSFNPRELNCGVAALEWENLDCTLGWAFHDEDKQPSLEERIETLSGLVREMLDLAKNKVENHCAGCPEHPVPEQKKCRVCDHSSRNGFSGLRTCPDKNCYCLDPFHE